MGPNTCFENFGNEVDSLIYGPQDGSVLYGVPAPFNPNSLANDLIPGSLKRSKSFHSHLGDKTYQELIQIAQGKGGEALKAKQMKKLIEQSKRLLDKIK